MFDVDGLQSGNVVSGRSCSINDFQHPIVPDLPSDGQEEEREKMRKSFGEKDYFDQIKEHYTSQPTRNKH